MPKTLLGESGATKIDWFEFDEHQRFRAFQTEGINPNFQSKVGILRILKEAFQESTDADRIIFYGAGLRKEENRSMVHHLIEKKHKRASVDTFTDILGAARACCMDKPGIVGILGTGSNSCYYDGGDLVRMIGGEGWDVGDEGGGADIGKVVVARVGAAGLDEEFFARFDKSPEEYLAEAMDGERPNVRVAGLAKFAFEFMPEMVEERIGIFLEKTIMQHDEHSDVPVHFVGSIAFHAQEVLKKLCEEKGITIGKVLKSPGEDLVKYHQTFD